MRLAFSTNAYLNASFPDAARRIAKIGYSGLELMADVPHAWPAYLLAEQKQAIGDALARHNLALSNINAFMMHAVNDPRQKYWHPSWIEPDPHYRRIRVEHTRRALTLARELGAANITTEPGGPVEPGASWSSALELFLAEIRPVADHALREGVLLLVEPEPGLLIETAEQFEEFIGRLDHPAVALNFDVGHAYCVGDEPSATFRRLFRHVRHVHLEDIAANRVHAHLIPGDGAIDLRGFLRTVRETGYAGWVTVELYPYAHDPDRAAELAHERVLKLCR
jgi:sugar phosphate isomerase/epimerase